MSSWMGSLLAQQVAAYAKQAVSVDIPEILELSAKVRPRRTIPPFLLTKS